MYTHIHIYYVLPNTLTRISLEPVTKPIIINPPSSFVTKVDENTFTPQLHYAHDKVANRPLTTLAAKYSYLDIMPRL